MQIMSNATSYALPLEPYTLLSNITSSELKTLCKTFPILKTNPEVISASVNIWHSNSLKLCVQKSLLDNILSQCLS